MHQKFWIFDEARVYIGSANMDWLSLTQVKEMGVALDGQRGWLLSQDLQKLFDRWWIWTAPDFKPRSSKKEWDKTIQASRTMPCWERLPTDPDAKHCQLPFPASTESPFNFNALMPLVLNNTAAGTFISCSPPAVCDTPMA